MKTWLKLISIFTVVGAVIAGIFWMDSNRRATMTAQAEAIVTGAVLHEDDESSSLDETRIAYRFPVADASVDGMDIMPGDRVADWPAGRSVSICYNPEDPTVSGIRDSGTTCG